MTQVPKKCTIPVNRGRGRGVPIAFLHSVERVLSQLSQYDCAASGVNSPQVVAKTCIGVLAPLCWDRKEYNAPYSRTVNLAFEFRGKLADSPGLNLVRLPSRPLDSDESDESA